MTVFGGGSSTGVASSCADGFAPRHLKTTDSSCANRVLARQYGDGQPSDADDINQIIEAGEFVGISGVERQVVGRALAAFSRSATRRRCDRPVSATAAIASSCGSIEPKGLERRFHLLKASLTVCALGPFAANVEVRMASILWNNSYDASADAFYNKSAWDPLLRPECADLLSPCSTDSGCRGDRRGRYPCTPGSDGPADHSSPQSACRLRRLPT